MLLNINDNLISMDKPLRPRIPYKPKELPQLVVDELAFMKNKSSNKARKIRTIKEVLNLHVWFDKHYHNRQQFGEDDGVKRDGIEPQIVEDLIIRSIKHLFYYSSTLLTFRFINLDEINSIRVNLRDIAYDVPLNVVTEVHFLDVNEFEITVITAMCIEDFWKKQGRHVLELQGDNSVLYRTDNHSFTKLGEF